MTATSNKGGWTDKQKFCAETSRTIVFALAGTIAAIMFLKPSDQRAQFSAEVQSTKLKLRADAVEEFANASYLYTASAYAACTNEKDEAAKAKFQGESNLKFRLAGDRLSRMFAETSVPSDWKIVYALSNEMHDVCEHKQTPEEMRCKTWQMVKGEGPPVTGGNEYTDEELKEDHGCPSWKILRDALKNKDIALANTAWASLESQWKLPYHWR
jgi:hypothetical protein